MVSNGGVRRGRAGMERCGWVTPGKDRQANTKEFYDYEN